MCVCVCACTSVFYVFFHFNHIKYSQTKNKGVDEEKVGTLERSNLLEK